MLPFLVVAYDLSYTAAAALVFASNALSALVQPLFGYLGDKVDRPWFMSLGVMLSGGGVAAMGFCHSYWAIFCCAVTAGIGVALFHPEGGKLANVVAGANKGASISNFSVGGNLGFAIGPVITTFALSAWGMQGTAILVVPAVAAAALLLSQTRAFHRMTAQEAERIAESSPAGQKDDWVGFSKVTSVNIARAIIGNSLLTFIPLYWIAVLGQSHEFSALMITVYSLGGAVATFVGGRIADRVGLKRMVLISIGCVGPLLLAFLFMDQVIPATVLLVLFACMHSVGHAPMVALGQAYLPNRIGFASGISLGVVVGMGGIAAPGIGAIGDVWGLQVSLAVVCAIAFVGLGIASLLYTGRNAHESIGAPPD